VRSTLEVFRIGVGPSSSHTVGPMRIAHRFVSELSQDDLLSLFSVEIDLLGSLALTGIGHGTIDAVIMGLAGYEPHSVDLDQAQRYLGEVRSTKKVRLGPGTTIDFDPKVHIRLLTECSPGKHPNQIIMRARNKLNQIVLESTFYSIGGGEIASCGEMGANSQTSFTNQMPHKFESCDELLELCETSGLSISEIMLENEDAIRPRVETASALDRIWGEMRNSIQRGLTAEGTLPGGLMVERRAKSLWSKCEPESGANEKEVLFDRLNAFALAVNEENASGGKIVTAPTNGAAGIIPAIIEEYVAPATDKPHSVQRFLLVASAIAMLFRRKVSITGAAMGCQGEVGVASSMAAAALADFWGGDHREVTNAAEIAMEHSLGLTCDPVGGLVQIPCIERNAVASVKAVNSARLAIHSTGKPRVSLDQVIETMRQTGEDMSNKYKETSLGGLAVNVVAC